MRFSEVYVITKVMILFSMMIFSMPIFSQEKIEDLPREKNKSLGKWEVVPSLTSKEDNKQERKSRRKRSFTKRNRNKNVPVLTLEKEDEALVVYNKNRRSTGTVNGTLIVNLKDIGDERDLLRDFPIKKMRLEKRIKLGIYKVKAGNDIEQVVNNLKKDPRVKSVEVEVITNTGGLKPQ